MDKELSRLALVVGRLAVCRGVMLSVAESCTGGLVSAALTHSPGSSRWFSRGFICYDNASKKEMLHISPEILTAFGAVSEQTAAAMCYEAGAYSLAITGIAGPASGENKPVGMVCFGWRIMDNTRTETKHFSGGREEIRNFAACYALSEMAEMLDK